MAEPYARQRRTWNFFFGLIIARLCTVRFLSAVRAPCGGGTLQAPLYPRPRHIPKKKKEKRANQGNYKGKKQRKSVACPLLLPRGCHEIGCRISGDSSLPPFPSAPTPRSSSHSRTSASDTSLTVASSSAGTLLPTSVEVRKSSTARLHLLCARSSRILHRLFLLPVPFRTSSHRTVCCGFHSGHSLKRWSRVYVRYWHQQH